MRASKPVCLTYEKWTDAAQTAESDTTQAKQARWGAMSHHVKCCDNHVQSRCLLVAATPQDPSDCACSHATQAEEILVIAPRWTGCVCEHVVN